MDADVISIIAIIVPIMTGLLVVAVMVGKHISDDKAFQDKMDSATVRTEEFRNVIISNFDEVKAKQDHANGTLAEHDVLLGRHHERVKNLEMIEERRIRQ